MPGRFLRACALTARVPIERNRRAVLPFLGLPQPGRPAAQWTPVRAPAAGGWKSQPAERAKEVTDVSSAEHTRRDFLYIATAAVGAVGATATLVPLITQMNPDASTIAAGAPI